MRTDPGAAKSALDRIVIPQDVVDRIASIAPRSSLIITDEALSSETGKGTDFVVLLSGEPQGGIKMRRRGLPGDEFSYARPRDRMQYWRWLTGVFSNMPTCSAPAVILTASGFHRVKALTGPPDHERHDRQ